jgi:ABC-type lipoprotein export system ATPase subunit
MEDTFTVLHSQFGPDWRPGGDMMDPAVVDRKICDLTSEYPYVSDFFSSLGLTEVEPEDTVAQVIGGLTAETVENCGLSREQLMESFTDFMVKMVELQARTSRRLRELTIIGGYDKSGIPEECRLTLRPGEIISIVGPTGSGKSRLLADIECLAQADTPTGRRILVDGKEPDGDQRFALGNKLVAQLSQNMNFVVDLTVAEFVTMHAESRMVNDAAEMAATVIAGANELAGEQFAPDISLTQLSGGQSRALMIADTALLSVSPLILIDEIENAGVDRKKALELLVRKEKIVLMATHDPILALLGQRRIVIKNGGIHRIIATGAKEQANLVFLENLDRKMLELRDTLRTGGRLDMDIRRFLQLDY